MTDPNFHQRMVNIPVEEASPAFPEAPHLQLVYRYGHRDARHAAAEIANEADETIDALTKALDMERTTAKFLEEAAALRERIANRETATPETTSDDRERFAAAINEARAWMQSHRGGEWVGWSAAVLTGTQEVTSPGWYALPPGQWCSEPAILIEHTTRDGMELPTVEQAVERWGVPVKAEE